MRKIQFATGQFYHVFNRGVEKRDIFLDDKDYSRFLLGLTEFNTVNPVELFMIKKYGKKTESSPLVRPGLLLGRPGLTIQPFVKIHGFCLMPNHYHLLLEQIQDGGISSFMQKLGTGFSMYRNMKYGRVGPLFQGRFKAILIDEEVYLTHLLRYIHLNPVELIEPKWKENGIKNWKKANKFLDSYKWSSFHEYNGKTMYPDIVKNDFLLDLVGGFEGHRQFVKEWLVKDAEEISDLTFE